MIDRHVPLEWDKWSKPWGIASDWQYPASLLSDKDTSEAKEGGAEAAVQHSKTGGGK
jgi:hypothetical protein